MIQEKFRKCIEACYHCADACDHCATACLQEEHVKAMVICVHLDRFCAETCRMAASFMAKTSGIGHDGYDGYVTQLCDLCAQICDDCANECEKHDLEHCRICAEACRRCAEACKQMKAA